MADESAAVETVRVFDLNEQKYVDKPASEVKISNPNPIPTPAAVEQPPAEEEKKPEPPPAEGGAKVDPPPAEGGKPNEEKKPEQPTGSTFEPGSFIKEKWGKYGVQTEADVEKSLQVQNELIEKHTALKVEHDKLKAEPKYRTDQEKKIAEFLAPYDPSKFGEGLNTVAEIMAMDPANVSGKKALEEAYIIKHPNLTREEAKELFTEDYNTRFTIDRDDFDTDEAYNQKKRILDIHLKNEEAQARKELTDKKETLKYVAPVKKTDEPNQNKPAEIPVETVQGYQKDLETFFNPSKDKKFDRIHYMSDDGKEVFFSMVFDQEKIDAAKTFVTEFVKNPASYGKDGKIANFAPEELTKTALRILYGDWWDTEMWKNIKTVAGRMKAEQIAGASLEKKGSVQGDAKASIDDQWKTLAKTEVEKRQGR